MQGDGSDFGDWSWPSWLGVLPSPAGFCILRDVLDWTAEATSETEHVRRALWLSTFFILLFIFRRFWSHGPEFMPHMPIWNTDSFNNFDGALNVVIVVVQCHGCRDGDRSLQVCAYLNKLTMTMTMTVTVAVVIQCSSITFIYCPHWMLFVMCVKAAWPLVLLSIMYLCSTLSLDGLS